MATENKLSLSKKRDQMLTAIAVIIGLAIGIVVQQLTETDNIFVILYVTVLVFGVYFLVSVPFVNNESDYIPSQRSFRLVWGVLLTTIGSLLLVDEYAQQEFWIYIVVLLIVVAVLIMVLFMNSKKQGDQ